MGGSGPEDILAVVISHNPAGDFAGNLRALRRQFARVLVIDNGSHDGDAVRHIAVQSGCEFHGNARNLGIASALNQGVAAMDGACRWLATFDQDSLLPDGAVDALLSTWAGHPRRAQVGILALANRDRGTGTGSHRTSDVLRQSTSWRELRTTITSGSLVRREVFEAIGGFDDGLFIDAVDHDFCLRARRAGFGVVEVMSPVMAHSVGAATVRTVLGVRVPCSNHSPHRRYYMVRNQLEVCRRHLWFDPVWAWGAFLQVGSGAAAAVLLESHKRAKLRAVLMGLAHFLVRRFGPL